MKTVKFLIITAFSLLFIWGCKKNDDDNNDPPPDQTVKDIDGNAYHTVTIGTQIWMVENLKVTHYRNGEDIATTTPATLNTSSESTPTYQWSFNGNESNTSVYGRLYTWHVVNDSRGICPTGWHVPTDAEWTILINYLGGENVSGGKMKETGTAHWDAPNTGATNESGFKGLPGGYRNDNGVFYKLGSFGYWWSSTQNGADYGWYVGLDCDYTKSYHYYSYKSMGYSVRCIKD